MLELWSEDDEHDVERGDDGDTGDDNASNNVPDVVGDVGNTDDTELADPVKRVDTKTAKRSGHYDLDDFSASHDV